MSERIAVRDELAERLRAGFAAILKETDDWRPLADHVLDLIAAARTASRQTVTENP